MRDGASKRLPAIGREALPWAARAAIVPALVVFAVELLLSAGDPVFPLDDSYIHLVFGRSLAAGAGLAFNEGVPVAGTTSPLWTALVGLLALLPGSVVVWVRLAGLAFHFATIAATWRLGRALGLSRARATLAAALAGLSGWLVFSSISGMEVPLFTALSLAGIARHVSERDAGGGAPLSFLLFALAALARPEGLLLLPLAAFDRALRVVRGGDAARFELRDLVPIALGALVAALVILPVGAAFLEISGSVFPTTLVAKSSGPPALVPQISFLRAVLGLLFSWEPWATLFAAGGAVTLAGRLGGARDRGLLLALWAGALPLGSAMLSSGQEIAVGNFGRYFFPLVPPLFVLALLAFESIDFSRLRRMGPVPVGALLLALLVAPTVAGLFGAAGVYFRASSDVRASDLAAARWLAPRLDPRAVVAVNDIGAVRWTLPNELLDLVGIVDPPIAARRRAGVAAKENYVIVLQEIVERRKPDFVLVFPGWFPNLERDPSRYPRLRTWSVPGNVAMAGDMMALYATPWTRWPLASPPDTAKDPGDEPTETP